jgi:FKBP-type peptidyl-prolyl cis-trans isomerase FkpA
MARALVLGVGLLFLVSACTNSSHGPGSDECVEDNRLTKESGLEVVDIACGTGAEAAGGMAVTVHYVGRLESGVVFDSSRARHVPYQFLLGAGRVMPGWDEGVAGMRIGGIRRLIIPPDLAYGSSGFPPRIPPDETLTYDVELLEVRAPDD